MQVTDTVDLGSHLIHIAITAMALFLFPRLVKVAEGYLNIKLDARENAAFNTLLTAAAGVIETKLDQGAMSLLDVNRTNPHVVEQATRIITALGGAAIKYNVTGDVLANAIVGMVDTGSRSLPAGLEAPNPGPSILDPKSPQ